MATQQLIDIVIKASDRASSIASDVDKRMQDLGKNTAKANAQAAKSADTLNKSMLRAGDSMQVVGSGAVQAAQMLQRVQMDPNFGSSINRAKLELSQMGVNINSVSGRFKVLTSASQIAFGRLKNSVSDTASAIKTKLSNALNGLKAKLQESAKGFNGFNSKMELIKGTIANFAGNFLFSLANGIMEMAKESINAAGQLDYFAGRLSKMQGDVKLSAQGFEDFKTKLSDLQKEFRKVDMTAVGATAEEMAVKFKLPSKELDQLTRMTAIVSSAFVKEGSTQENAVLAVSDALDGQFRRLQEIGITQDVLVKNGYKGDLEDKANLMESINKSLDELGFTETAKDITNVEEAMTALNVAGGQLLQKILVPLTPVIIQVVDFLLKFADAVGGMISALSGMPDWEQLGLGVAAFGLAIAGVSTAIKIGMIPALGEMLAPLAAATLQAWEFAAALLANPLTWVAIALAAIAVVVYEVGKSFGWWTDIGSMLDAVWAGIQRLWAAFINHPDVQAFIQGMRDAWAALQPYVQSVVDWIGSFFSTQNSGNFDIVRALIDSVSATWERMTYPIRLVIAVIKILILKFAETRARARLEIDKIRDYFAKLPDRIRNAIHSIVSVITQPFKDAYTKVKAKVDEIKSYVDKLTDLNLGSITDAITKPFRDAYNSVCEWVDKIKKKAQEAANNPLGFFGFGGQDLMYGGLDLLDPEDLPKVYSNTGSNDMHVINDINLNLDLRNVPSGIDQELLEAAVIESVTSKPVINALVNNTDFQNLDSKVKNRLSLKNNRARGV